MFIELHVETGQLQLMIFGLKFVLGQVDDSVVFLNFDQHSLAIGRYLIGVDIAQNDFLAVFQAIRTKVRLPIATVLICFVLIFLIRNGAAEIENAIVDYPDVAVVTRHVFNSGMGSGVTTESNLNNYRLLGFYFGVGVGVGLFGGGGELFSLGFFFSP